MNNQSQSNEHASTINTNINIHDEMELEEEKTHQNDVHHINIYHEDDTMILSNIQSHYHHMINLEFYDNENNELDAIGLQNLQQISNLSTTDTMNENAQQISISTADTVNDE